MLRYNTSENICESEVTDVNTIELIEVALPHERMAYRDILLLADDWEEEVERYIREGELYIAADGQRVLGACLMIPASPDKAEIKYIAVLPEYRGKGLGKEIIRGKRHPRAGHGRV